MSRFRMLFLLIGPALLSWTCPTAAAAERIAVISGPMASETDQRLTRLLADRLREFATADIVETPHRDPHASIEIVIGQVSHHPLLLDLCDEYRIQPPTDQEPGPEGFVLAARRESGRLLLLAAADDSRGVLYAVGEILRQFSSGNGSLQLATPWDLRTAPAFELRGTEVSQGRTIRELSGARKWTAQEWQRAVTEYALAGANVISLGHVRGESDADYRFVKSLGLDVLLSHCPNAGSGPDEWAAAEGIGRRGYLCPSVPEARDALLKACEQRFAHAAAPDFVRMNAGDGGGCECDRCAPFGAPFVRLCHDMADIIHRFHPQAQIFITNQKLDNAGDQAIFDYLRQTPGDWLRAVCYGPGSNAMGWMPGRRQDHRTDLFRYPAFGALDRYCREIVHQLPPQHDLVFFTDLTHWVYSQYGLLDHEMLADRNGATPPASDPWMYSSKPDQYLHMVYNRRTFHARPRHYHHAFRETQRYGIGDVTYSEGHHDHFNQWMQQRLLWSPEQSVEEVVEEYARVHFGTAAARLMSQAIFQLEQNLSTPVVKNAGLDRQLSLVRRAGSLIPQPRRQTCYLWYQYLQKALLDKYIQLRAIRQLDIQQNANQLLTAALQQDDPQSAVEQALEVLRQNPETTSMVQLRQQADEAGTRSDRIYGMRSEGQSALDIDLVGLGWLTQEVQRAVQTDGDEQRRIIHQLVHYEDAGPGGFFDDLGDPERSPHLVKGWSYDGGPFPTSLRPSQRTTAFTTDEAEGVTLEYRRLDPQGRYRVRLALVRPVYRERFAVRQPQTSQSIWVDDQLLAENVELSKGQVRIVEYEVPPAAVADGRLRLILKKMPGVGEGPQPEVTVWRNTGGWGTLASDVWLLKQAN